jgi:hypothetical protein
MFQTGRLLTPALSSFSEERENYLVGRFPLRLQRMKKQPPFLEAVAFSDLMPAVAHGYGVGGLGVGVLAFALPPPESTMMRALL